MTNKSKYGKKSTHQWISSQRNNYSDFLHDVEIAIREKPSMPSDPSWIKDLGSVLNAIFAPQLHRLAFLACTGKVELPVRDEVLWQLTQHIPSSLDTNQEWYGREYKSVDGVKGLGLSGTQAIAAFQAKQICVADIYDPKNDLLLHLNLDIRLKAPWNLENQSASIQVGLLLVIDYGIARPDALLPNTEKYSNQMKKQWRQEGFPNWQSELATQLRKLRLSIQDQNVWNLESSAKWPGLKLHWFLVTPDKPNGLHESRGDSEQQLNGLNVAHIFV